LAMRVEIHISSVLYRKIPGMIKLPDNHTWELPDGTRIGDVLEMLGLTPIPTILMLNKSQGNRDSRLKDGDILKIFSVISGG
jgi:sulfur carrier protein ThiS